MCDVTIQQQSPVVLADARLDPRFAQKAARWRGSSCRTGPAEFGDRPDLQVSSCQQK
jgi:hypothetical protein